MIVLVSSSPRRRRILREMGFRFRVTDPLFKDELPMEGESVEDYALRMARLKVESVELFGGEVGVGMDTVVFVDGKIMGKPNDPAQAKDMLRMLSNRIHTVFTGVWLKKGGKGVGGVEKSCVEFVDVTDELMEWYISTGEWKDKAGGYGIQGYGRKLVRRWEGDYWNIVGFPKGLFISLLKELGYESF